MTHCLVTGATGFIGGNLVRHLAQRGDEVTCLVRESSDRTRLDPHQPHYVVGSLGDRESIRSALDRVDVVYHLAGVTKALTKETLYQANRDGAGLIAECCANVDRPPTLVLVSSLAAAGPTSIDQPLSEQDPPAPVSAYGKSKREGELAVLKFAADVPTTIVRPPIVLGEGDRDGFALFEGIVRWGIHLVPGWADTKVSVVHADDLASALILSAERGRRVTVEKGDASGIYYAAADEMPTYAGLGKMIGDLVGRPHAVVVRSPGPLVWTIAGINEIVSKIRRKPHILNLDKAREATAGSWICSSETLKRETGFEPAKSLQDRIAQTARWYFDHGWLKKPRRYREPE